MNETQVNESHRLAVYMEREDEMVCLFAGEIERTEGFLKFWKLYRPYTNIEVQKLSTLGSKTTIYRGEARDYTRGF
jgi:hypothetical protein